MGKELTVDALHAHLEALSKERGDNGDTPGWIAGGDLSTDPEIVGASNTLLGERLGHNTGRSR